MFMRFVLPILLSLAAKQIKKSNGSKRSRRR